MSVADAARALLEGSRMDSYGPPAETAKRFSDVARALTGLDIEPEHYPVVMIAAKLARDGMLTQPDTRVDLVAYLEIADMFMDRSPRDLSLPAVLSKLRDTR